MVRSASSHGERLLHIKREQEQAREPKRFRRELIVCAGPKEVPL